MPSDSSQHSLSDLSARFDLELHGDGDHLIRSAGTLQGADSSSIAFLANPAYRAVLPQTTAGAVILRKEDAPDCPTNYLVSDDPYLAYARIATLFDPRPEAVPGIHPSAVIDESVKLGTNLSIGPNVTIEAGSTIGDGSTLSPGVVVGTGCEIGNQCVLRANVSLCHGVKLGQRVLLHPGVVIGADGFGIAFAGDHWEKVPQIGNVIIGDDCEIGANSCVDRGAIGDTVLEEDVRLDNLVQIGHNVTIGAHSALAGTAAVAGSTTIGKYCLIAGGAGIAGHLEIADRVTITANAKVMRSILDDGSTVGSIIPAQPFHEWQKILARLLKIDRLAKRLRTLEKTMEAKSHNE
jgi:UDP-3-O-[3-hydroxymyristoyl] glucosamine N-acyltransferase